jgi:LAO/AO transport system kinase
MITNEIPPGARELLDRLRSGHRLALARAISMVENGKPGFEWLLHEIHRELGRAQRIGVTGPPGAGKSTLVSGLTRELRGRGETVGIVAVDPTSPFTGGALLGDRIRMNDLATDDGVFIRSMATRGSLGGLSTSTHEVADLLDAFGFSRVLLETVGVGQSELDIAGAADTTVVVLVPESGDSIQAMKAGLMEIADVFVINKADRPGADRLAQELELMLHMRMGEGGSAGAGHHGVSLRSVGRSARERAKEAAAQRHEWAIPVLKAIGQSGEGVAELLAIIDGHTGYLEESGELSRRRRARLADRVRGVVDRLLRRWTWSDGRGEELLAGALAELETGELSPYEVGDRIVRAITSSTR